MLVAVKAIAVDTKRNEMIVRCVMGCDVMHKEKGIEGRRTRDGWKWEQGDGIHMMMKSTLLNGFQNKTINEMKADSW